MSLDRSLKVASGMGQHRNVLTRPERIAKMREDGRFGKESTPIHLPKVGNRKVGGKKGAAKKEAGAEGAAAPAAGAAAPAGGAKAAAPAAKGAAKK